MEPASTPPDSARCPRWLRGRRASSLVSREYRTAISESAGAQQGKAPAVHLPLPGFSTPHETCGVLQAQNIRGFPLVLTGPDEGIHRGTDHSDHDLDGPFAIWTDPSITAYKIAGQRGIRDSTQGGIGDRRKICMAIDGAPTELNVPASRRLRQRPSGKGRRIPTLHGLSA